MERKSVWTTSIAVPAASAERARSTPARRVSRSHAITLPPGALRAASCVVLFPGAAQQSRMSSPGSGASAAGAKHDALS